MKTKLSLIDRLFAVALVILFLVLGSWIILLGHWLGEAL